MDGDGNGVRVTRLSEGGQQKVVERRRGGR